jgi:hypothetical protein
VGLAARGIEGYMRMNEIPTTVGLTKAHLSKTAKGAAASVEWCQQESKDGPSPGFLVESIDYALTGHVDRLGKDDTCNDALLRHVSLQQSGVTVVRRLC